MAAGRGGHVGGLPAEQVGRPVMSDSDLGLFEQFRAITYLHGPPAPGNFKRPGGLKAGPANTTTTSITTITTTSSSIGERLLRLTCAPLKGRSSSEQFRAAPSSSEQLRAALSDSEQFHEMANSKVKSLLFTD